MARSFNGSTNYVVASNTPITDYPITLNCWYRFATAPTTAEVMFQVVDSFSTSRWFSLQLRGTAGNPMRFFVRSGATAGNDTGNTSSTNTWHMATGKSSGSTDHQCLLDADAANKATDPSLVTMDAGLDHINIGRSGDDSPAQYFGGDVGECAIWNVALTDEEIASLYNGGIAVPAWTVRPRNLVFYAPLLDADGDIDWAGDGTYDLTAVNAPAYAKHVPIVSPIMRGFPSTGLPANQQLLINSESVYETLGDIEVFQQLELDSSSQYETLGDIELFQQLELDSASQYETQGDAQSFQALLLDSESVYETRGDAVSGVQLLGLDSASTYETRGDAEHIPLPLETDSESLFLTNGDAQVIAIDQLLTDSASTYETLGDAVTAALQQLELDSFASYLTVGEPTVIDKLAVDSESVFQTRGTITIGVFAYNPNRTCSSSYEDRTCVSQGV